MAANNRGKGSQEPERRERRERGENAVLVAARGYTRRGWRVVPVIPGQKGVAITGWQWLRLAEDDVPKWFGQIGGTGNFQHNIGILTGEPSGGLVDVDCDAPEAREAAKDLLPPTGLISGREGNPASHYWYRIEGGEPAILVTTKFVAPSPNLSPTGRGEPEDARSGPPPASGEGLGVGVAHHTTMLIELRSTGCQTLAPPSVHPSGEAVRWEREGEPGSVAAGALLAAVARVAAVALLARHWPGVGQRDEAAKDLAGLLLRAGWQPEAVDQFVTLVARIAGDEEWRRRAKARGTARKLSEGGHVTGGHALAGRLSGAAGDGERVVAQVRAWLRLPTTGGLGSAYVSEGGHEEAHTHKMTFFAPDDLLGQIGAVGEVGMLLGEVAPTPVRPLWGGRLYLGKLTICDGDPGHGKTLLALDLAARITTGREMPDGSPGMDPAGVVYFTAEDDPADTLRPRLDAAGGDADRLLAVTTVPLLTSDGTRVERQPTFRDLEMIARAIARVEAKLVIFDPFMAYLDSQTNSFRDQDVRGMLAPLARLAERTDTAFFLIRHLNKMAGGRALYRGGGSIGIIGAARSGLLVGRDPDDPERRVVASTKNNLSTPPASLVYRVIATGSGAPIIQWEGETSYDARALLHAEETEPERDSPALGRAKALLKELLLQGPLPEVRIRAHAREEGVSETTLKRARQHLRIRSKKAGFADGWLWCLPDSHGDNAGNRPNAVDASDVADGMPGLPQAPKKVTMPEEGHVHMMTLFDDPLRAQSSVGGMCPATGGPHEYAQMRDAMGRLLCVECGSVGLTLSPSRRGEPEADDGVAGGDEGDGGQDGREARG